jgi:hypothetical protein
MNNQYEVYSQLTNKLYYTKVYKTEEYTEKDSILYKTKYDDKIILILHELYLGSTFRRQSILSLDYLISRCGYKVDKDNRKNFKITLNKLKQLDIINFKEFNKSNDIIEINTENILIESNDNYTQLSDEELEKLNDITNTRLKTTLLKLYLYLKARVYKRGKSDTGKTYDIGVDYRSQTTYQNYETIEQYTNISESRIKTYIDILQDKQLITYKNFGKKYKEYDKQKRLSECPNVYAINCLCEDIEAELELGIKQCKYILQEQGYIITNVDYKNNDRQLNGRKGYLKKKINNGTITTEEQNEYNEMCI